MDTKAQPNSKFKNWLDMTPKEQRNFWFRKVKSNFDAIQKLYQKEIKRYLRVYRNQFNEILPDEVFQRRSVDVNIVYPILKTLLPKLYFQDPKVFIKPLEETIIVPQTQMVDDGQGGQIEQPVIDPLTQQPLTDQYDGVESAKVIQGQVNYNIRQAKLKNHVKMAIYDAHLGYYGAIKTGFGNDQGNQSMGEGAPVSPREDIDDTLNYGIRMKPWDVIPDLNDFYNQEWTGLYYCVHPSKLINDPRLNYTDKIVGKAKMSDTLSKQRGQFLDDSDKVLTEYYEVYVKPSSLYPEGLFLIISAEVEDDFLYCGPWPYESKGNPIKFLFFNPDPEGGLPVPPVRYYIAQQNQKSTLRKISKEWVERALPFTGVDLSGCKDQALIQKALQSGEMPKFVRTDGKNPNTVFAAVSHPQLSSDFYKFDNQIDDDVSRMTGMITGVYPGSGANVDLASVAKMTNSGDAIRQGEQSDLVSDFLKEILNQWVDYLKEFAGPNNYTMVEGAKYPQHWTRDQIRLRTDLEIKPFSMTYEDPMVVRRQWVDLLNLLGNPALQMSLQKQGAQIDFVKIIKRVLETYQERDAETFMLSGPNKAENQVQNAIQEGQNMAQGLPHQVQPTDNHMVHILIHHKDLLAGVTGAADAIKQHEMAMNSMIPGNPGGGGNPEGLPLNGGAVSQDQLKQPLQPSTQNKVNAMNHNIHKPTGNR